VHLIIEFFGTVARSFDVERPHRIVRMFGGKPPPAKLYMQPASDRSARLRGKTPIDASTLEPRHDG